MEEEKEIVPSKTKGFVMMKEYLLRAKGLRLRDMWYKLYQGKDLFNYIYINEEEIKYLKITVKEKIAPGVILERVAFNKKKTLYILIIEDIVPRIYVIHDDSHIIMDITTIAFGLIFNTLGDYVTLKNIEANEDFHIEYEGHIENKPIEIRFRESTFELPISVEGNRITISTKAFVNFIEFLIENMYKGERVI